MKEKIVVGITGASGACYAYQFLKKLTNLGFSKDNLAVVFTKNGYDVFNYEMGQDIFNEVKNEFTIYRNDSFMVPFASGSSDYTTLVVMPCSMGTLSKIATGAASDLISRTADVMLKERRKLILLTRETPLNLIHLENMVKVTQAGGIICPASPSFYSKPETVESLISTVTDRVLSLCGINHTGYEWMN